MEITNSLTNRVYLALLLAAVGLFGCSEDKVDQVIGRQITGEAQGTTYTITYIGDSTDYSFEIDSILQRFDNDLSVWVPGSLINRINDHNRRDTVYAFYDTTKYFSVVFDMSREIYKKTDGAFDPTVYPLVSAWGFGLEKRAEVDDQMIDSLLRFVGFTEFNIDMIEREEDYRYKRTDIWKGSPNTKLDFNAIAQGYSVDVVAEFLEDSGIIDYMIEIGGEVLCSGVNPEGKLWRIAIDKPEMERQVDEFEAVISLDNRAIATSGNYRRFYEKDGVKYAHTIDPRTGYPVQHSLLSATVVANTCAKADAYATAFMVMGIDATVEFLAAHPDEGLDVYLIFDNDGTLQPIMTEGMKAMIPEVEKEQ